MGAMGHIVLGTSSSTIHIVGPVQRCKVTGDYPLTVNTLPSPHPELF